MLNLVSRILNYDWCPKQTASLLLMTSQYKRYCSLFCLENNLTDKKPQVECRHNSFVIPDYSKRLDSAQAQVKETLENDPEADIYDAELVPANTWWSPRMIAKSGHEFQVRVNFVGRNNYLGRDYSKSGIDILSLLIN